MAKLIIWTSLCASLLALLLALSGAVFATDPFDNVDPFGGGAVNPAGGADVKEPAPDYSTWNYRDPNRRTLTEAQFKAALEKPAKLTHTETPLAFIVDELRTKHEINIDVDREALANEGVSVGLPVTIGLDGVTLHNAIDLMLNDYDLGWIAHDGGVLITTKEIEEHHLTTAVYNIRGLDVPLHCGGGGQVEFGTLAQFFKFVVAPTSWDNFRSRGSTVVLHDQLIIRQSRRPQREVEQLLDGMRRAGRVLAESRRRPPSVPFICTQPGSERIYRALDEQTSLDFIESPLIEVVDYLKARHKIEIHIDRAAMANADVRLDQPINIRLKDVRLRPALKLAFLPHKLTYLVQGDVLVITTQEAAEQQPQVRLYPVADLVMSPVEQAALIDGDGTFCIRALADAIVRMVAPQTWVNARGPGGIYSVGDVLVISQTQDAHEQILRFLAAMRGVAAAKERPLSQPLHIAGEQRAILQAVLDNNVDEVKLAEVVLPDLVYYLTDLSGVGFRLDYRALEDAGVDPESPVTGEFHDKPLGKTLQRLLEPLGLTYTVQPGEILITTPERAASFMRPKIYDVSDLVARPRSSPASNNVDGMHRLGDAIVEAIHSDTWEDAGGPAAIEYSDVRLDVLYILQTEAVHRDVQTLLSGLRAGIAKASRTRRAADGELDSTAQQDKNGDQVVLKIYPLAVSPNDARDLVEVVSDLIDRKSWPADEAYYLRSLSTHLIVRHTPHTHRKVERLMLELGVLEPPFCVWELLDEPSGRHGVFGGARPDNLPGGVF